MLNIIICDDDKFILQLSVEIIRDLILHYNLPAQLVCSSTDSSHILQFMKSNQGDYLIFLDLDFGSGRLNGMDVAVQIKGIQSKSKVVFITNHHEMAMNVLTSGVEPFGFIEKSTDMKRFQDKYFKYIHLALSFFGTQKSSEHMLELVLGADEVINIDRARITYLEAEKSVSHGITYHTIDGSSITVRDSMEHCQSILGTHFIRVHRSFLLNTSYIVSLKGTNILLANGQMIPCSVRMKSEVKKCLKDR